MEDTAPEAVRAEGNVAERRRAYLKRLGALEADAQSWIDHWKDISSHILPRSRFSVLSDTQQGGQRKHRAIVNNAAGMALRTAVSGMVSGLTSPSRPWRRLGLQDPEAAESATARSVLHAMESRLELATSKSNVYQALAALYLDLLAFGTGCIFVDEDDEDLWRAYHLAVGTYYLACGSRGVPDTLYRVLAFTVSQLVEKFGEANCSARVLNMFKSGRLDDRVEVVHVVEENEAYDDGKPLSRDSGKAWKSCWFERGGGKTSDSATLGFLAESGYHERPFFAVRWMVLGEDSYGSLCPGMEALGDVKDLQAHEVSKSLVVEQLANPAKVVPHGMAEVSTLPGATYYLPPSVAQFEVKPVYVPHPSAIPAIAADIQELKQRITNTMMASLWSMLSQAAQQGGQRTAEEIRALVAEQLIQLSPLLTRLNDELLDPLTDRQLGIMLRSGAFSDLEWPDDLQGQQIRVSYISMLHTAQQAVALGGLQQLVQFVAGLATSGRPDALEKLNIDKMIDEAARVLGTKPDMLLTDEELAAVRQARQQAQQAKAAAEVAPTITGGIKDLAQAGVGADNVLGRAPQANPQAVG